MKKIYTTGDVAKLLGVNINTVIKWFDEGVLAGFRLPGSADRRIPASSLLKFMGANGIPMDLINADTPARRAHIRFPCGEPAELMILNGHEYGPYPAVIADVSEGGARLRVRSRDALSIPPNESKLAVTIASGLLAGARWKGLIVHLQPSRDGLAIGMSFLALAAPEKRRLTQFLATLHQ
jgi:excisionase family DNA binding protein